MIFTELKHAEMLLAWVMLVFSALCFAVTLCNPGLPALDGATLVIDHPDLWSKMDPISHAIYCFGDLFCPQKSARSLIIFGSQMPFCVRETGFSIGMGLGLSIATVLGHHPTKRILLLCVIISPLMMYDWIFKAITGIDIIAFAAITGIISGVFSMITIHYLEVIFCNRVFPESEKEEL